MGSKMRYHNHLKLRHMAAILKKKINLDNSQDHSCSYCLTLCKLVAVMVGSYSLGHL